KSIQQALEFYQNNFGILSSHIQEDLIYWCQDCSLDLVVEAMKRALANQKPYSYAQGILKSWLRKNIRTLEQVQAETIQHKQQQRNGNQQPVYHVEDYRKELYGE
ncbi:MAG: DnaD domain protein, partial [Aerococcaceae bacterium]|nr:DnaD domain protein [Aerococcaceae bacterium]